MRTRFSFAAIFLSTAVALVAALPFVARANLYSELEIYSYGWFGVSITNYNGYGNYQTALKAGDTVSMRLQILSAYGAPTVSVDLSAIGGPSATSTKAFARGTAVVNYTRPSMSDYFYNFGPITISADVADGVKDMPITITSGQVGGGTASAVLHIVIDNEPPSASVTSVTFSDLPLQDSGFTLYLSGRANGTGTQAYVPGFFVIYLKPDGSPIYGANFIYAGSAFPALNDAISSSADGSFTNVPISLYNFDSRFSVSDAAAFHVILGVADQAGNLIETELVANIPPPDPCANGGCASSVLFLPGIEGSRLYVKDPDGNERKIWEPNKNEDISFLAMTANGDSINTVYTRDVIDRVWGWFTDMYGSFGNYMDGLVADGKIASWRAYPYDWRYDAFDVVDGGSLKEDGSREYLIDDVKNLARTSQTGKVTIVGHSNGGLIAKALMIRLAETGEADLIDRVILVASPEVGTPETVFTLLHGYDQNYGLGFVADASIVRAAVRNFPGVYGLLPSAAYFANVASPIANFTDDSTVVRYRKTFGPTLDSYKEMSQFVLNNPRTRQLPATNDLATPMQLNSALFAKASATHAAIDAWRPPEGITVNEIVGWGNETMANAVYENHLSFSCVQGSVICNSRKTLGYHPLSVVDGDGTVVSASASYLGEPSYFNLSDLNGGLFSKNYDHGNMFSSGVLDSFIKGLLSGAQDPETARYFSNAVPSGQGVRLVLVGAHSPVLISATDSVGRTTGIFPNPDPSSDLLITKNEIPGSSVIMSGEGKYLSLPEETPVTIALAGVGDGSVTLDVANGDGEILSSANDIPIASGGTMKTSVSGGNIGAVSVDLEGDGVTDVETVGAPSVSDMLGMLKTRILSLRSVVVRNRLTSSFRTVEKYARKIKLAARALADMEKLARSQAGRTITKEEAQSILVLIQNLKNHR